jgi:hypothetical protein
MAAEAGGNLGLLRLAGLLGGALGGHADRPVSGAKCAKQPFGQAGQLACADEVLLTAEYRSAAAPKAVWVLTELTS